MPDAPRPPIPSDSSAFRHRQRIGLAAIVPPALLEMFLPPLLPPGSAWAWVLGGAGWALFVGYATMRIWSILYVGGRKGRELVTTGPYAATRNPLYVGTLCFGLSCAAFLQSLIVLAATVVGGLVYRYRVIPAEERALEALHGEAYRAYRAATPRFLPRWRLPPAAPTSVLVLRGIRAEAPKLWRACLMPPAALLLTHLRHLPSWPHLQPWS